MQERISQKQKEKILNLFKRYDFEEDLLDWNALWDEKISEAENLRILEEYIRQSSSAPAIQQADANTKNVKNEKQYAENIKIEQYKEEEQQAKEDLNKAIEGISNNEKSNFNQYFLPLRNFIKAVVNSEGTLNSLFVWGAGGLGKSTNVLKAIREEGKNYVYISNYTTPLEFYNFLYEHKNDTIVLDDTENIFELGSKFVNLLKGTLWGVGKDNKRIVTYLTTDKRLRAPFQFEFTGKIFFLLNKMPDSKDALVSALLSRSLIYELKFSHKEIMEMFAEFVKVPYRKLLYKEKADIFQFLKANTDDTTEDLSLRTIVKMYDLYIQDKANWKEMSKVFLKKDEDLCAFKRIVAESKSLQEAETRFTSETGLTSRTFWRWKKKYNL